MFTTKKIGKRVNLASASLLAALACASGASAQAPASPPGGVAVAVPVAAPVAPPAAPNDAPKSELPSVALAPGKGLSVTAADKRFQMTIRPRIQLRDAYQHAADGADTNDVNVKTLRLFVQGFALTPDLKYTVQLAFGSGDFDKDSASPIFDAFVEYTRLRDFNVRVGQYFVPFDRARTIREFALQFVDRQQVVRELTLDRDVGLMFSSADLLGLGNRLAYNVFIGAGDGKNRVANTANRYASQVPSMLSVARLIVRPMGAFDDDQEGDLTRKKSVRLALGAAVGYSLSASRQRGTTGDTYTQGTFNYLHAEADAVLKYAGFSLLAEVVLRDANRRAHSGKDASGATIRDASVSGHGYFAQVGQMVSERLELTARWEDLYAQNGTAKKFEDLVKQSGRALGGGVNYYVNAHFFKLQSDYFYSFGEDFGRGSHGLRVQLDATF